jgi:hypothetical protein
MNAIQNWFNNPIFVKHLRSRLRRAQVIPAAVIVFVISVLLSYAGWQANWFNNGTTFAGLLVL